MIVICDVKTYGQQGAKVRELEAFLRKYVEQRSVPDAAGFKIVRQFISRELGELNRKFDKTVPLSMSVDFSEARGKGNIRFTRPNASSSVIYMDVYTVRAFRE